MTAARQERKPRHSGAIGMAGVGLWLLLGGVAAGLGASDPAITERVVVNRFTGLAIDGFDPVAYFVDSAAAAGRPEFELRAGGATWQFRNEGNRAAFAANPDVYKPRFGGYDPVALARGAATAGNPYLWLIARDRLYLFYNNEAREAFAADPENAIAAAERNWPAVQNTLIP
jgi:hypothetical protein